MNKHRICEGINPIAAAEIVSKGVAVIYQSGLVDIHSRVHCEKSSSAWLDLGHKPSGSKKKEKVSHAAFSPSEATLAVALSNNSLRTYDASTFEPLQVLNLRYKPRHVSWSHSETFIAVGGGDGGARYSGWADNQC